MKKIAFCLMMIFSSISVAYASDSSEIEALRQQLNARNVAMLDMQNTISQQEQTIRMLQGTVEDMATQIGTLNENQKVIYSEIELLKKNGIVSSSAGTNVSTSGTAATSAVPVAATATNANKPAAQASGTITADTKALYDDSYKKMAAGSYAEATKGFQELISKHADSALVPNSYYWIAQMQYKEKKYSQAKENFLMVTKFRDSQKRSDSIYKLGLISEIQKDSAKAKKFFALVIKQYPQETAAVLAQKELSKMQ